MLVRKLLAHGRSASRNRTFGGGTESALEKTSPAARSASIPEPADSYFRCARSPDFFHEFYRRLLASDPAIPPLFAGIDWSRQHTLLRSGLVMLLLFSSGNPAAAAALERIGRRHGRDGIDVEPRLYAHWTEALLETVAALDPAFSPAVDRAWRDAVQRGLVAMHVTDDVTATVSSGRSR